MRYLVIAVAGAIAIAVGGTAIALASIPDSHGVIHGCYTVKTGTLRVIDTGKGQKCATGQNALNWNQKGVKGPAGPQGPAGVSGYSVALCTVAEDNSGNLIVSSSSGGTCTASGSPQNRSFATLTCPAGKNALSSSGQPSQTTASISPVWFYLNSDATGYQWAIAIEALNPGAAANLEVTCANVS